ncbi:hypothetical protein L6452_23540 [Arctium lappa]|uniref:Uncharacterized protein n=1 Tax=Arctium lappa TaxID=4217 RepID=A0ACB9B1A9_ARCLA|nr:hypothetical protein L6452_23540 [Arctium lappa]
MGSETSPRLPFIDFSNVDQNTNDLDWDSTKSRVRQALEEFGCFEASFHNISSELRTSLFDSFQQLFDLPMETKLKNRSMKPFHGYIGQFPTLPLYESMGIDDATILEKTESFTKIFWPEGKPELSTAIQEYSSKLSKLDQMVRRMVLESLGLEKYMVEHMGSTYYLFRVMKYRRPETNESELGLKPHTDKSIVTIVHQNQVDGLEVQLKSGDWIKFQPSSPNSFVVMIADIFYAWTNGRIHSPNHRVVMSGERDRYSISLVALPKAGYVIKAPEEVVDEQHPLLFKPFDASEFYQFYGTEAGQNAECALTTYCVRSHRVAEQRSRFRIRNFGRKQRLS